MNETGLKDKYGLEIRLGDEVLLEGLRFDVIVNDFSKRIVIDGETGQAPLIDVHEKCEVIRRNGR